MDVLDPVANQNDYSTNLVRMMDVQYTIWGRVPRLWGREGYRCRGLTQYMTGTQADVDFAIKTIAEWIAANTAGNPLVVYDLKGCLNVPDLNRIEGNIAFLAERFNDLMYPPDTSVKEWETHGLPSSDDIRRISQMSVPLLKFFISNRKPQMFQRICVTILK